MTNPARWFISSSIPYVNARPHLGFALEIVQSDALARFRRSQGSEVHFLTGTDDNSLSNVRAAENNGISVGELVDRHSAAFFELREVLDLSFDDFIKTSSDPRHTPAVHRLWKHCEASGDIYKQAYRGLYCVGCEVFYKEPEVADGRCPVHLSQLEIVEEENFFFRLSRYQDALEKALESDRVRIEPLERRNEALGLLKSGLEDISISRSSHRARGWGIPVPGDESQIIYVWFDALANYISALGYAEDEEAFERFWLSSDVRAHVIGKDIVRQHALYWPAFLLSAGLPLPTVIYVHGFLSISGRKISKSLGSGVDPVELARTYGSDAIRYYLLAKVPSLKDSDFSLETFDRVYRSDLADQLGNLVSRAVALACKEGGIASSDRGFPEGASPLVEAALNLPQDIETFVDAFDFSAALGAIWGLVREANRYVVAAKPWERPPQSEERSPVVYLLLETLRWVAVHLEPFLPGTATEIVGRLGLISPETAGGFGEGAFQVRAGAGPLFPKSSRKGTDAHIAKVNTH